MALGAMIPRVTPELSRISNAYMLAIVHSDCSSRVRTSNIVTGNHLQKFLEGDQILEDLCALLWFCQKL